MKSAYLAVFLGVTVSACSLFGKKDAAEQEKSEPGATRQKIVAIPHDQLVTALPNAVADWTREAPQGNTTSAGNYELSQTAVTFKSVTGPKPASLTIEIVDGTHVPSVKSQLALLMHASDDVHQLKLTASGYAGIQRWQPASGEVSAFIVVAGRFLVKLRGVNVSPETFRQAVDLIDMRKLESLAGVPPAAQAAPMPAKTVNATSPLSSAPAPGASTTSGLPTSAL